MNIGPACSRGSIAMFARQHSLYQSQGQIPGILESGQADELRHSPAFTDQGQKDQRRQSAGKGNRQAHQREYPPVRIKAELEFPADLHEYHHGQRHIHA